MEPNSDRSASGFLLREDGPLTRLVRSHRLLFTLGFFGLLAAISVSVSFLLRFVVLGPWLVTDLDGWQAWWLAIDRKSVV